jgi:hypothetical protein
MKKNNILHTTKREELWIKSGEDFEEDTADVFFPDNIYEILQRTHSFITNSKRFIRATLNPDFQFEIRDSKINFWIECKFRENKSDIDYVNVFKFDQLSRYKSYENSFLFLCAKYNGEQYLYFVPMAHLNSDRLQFSFLEPYRLKFGPPVRPGIILKYLK